MRTRRTSRMRNPRFPYPTYPTNFKRVVGDPRSFPPQSRRSLLHGTRENFENFETEDSNWHKNHDAQYEVGVTPRQKRAFEKECQAIERRQPAIMDHGCFLGLAYSRAIKVGNRETADFPEYQYLTDGEHWAQHCREVSERLASEASKAKRAQRRREVSERALTAVVIDLTGADTEVILADTDRIAHSTALRLARSTELELVEAEMERLAARTAALEAQAMQVVLEREGAIQAAETFRVARAAARVRCEMLEANEEGDL
mmetsp:Transcript_23340/g.39019  ORF Transcript_23340/g.39019 Transcript_23340/m.39019 type:complete len:259 (-) Transcript_23340:452-1228(-)|eukprot:CAMPEP_0198224232 /NCGR_PEP_ID=MMETSP1445-20131203/95935_1 /TAXON_ID=36898 /ORGANISM="Pyramimonas sp., Strain CCMP2087" /LENGTH=258 /DNA_ID=CAMNT_0043903323 /DNA_START=201 /DNA_END=977 /DNA_ORIENTATION=-